MRRARTLLAALALLAWLASSATTVSSGARGVVQRFGRVARELPPGFHLKAPWPIERVTVVDVEVSRRMTLGYRPEEEARGLGPDSREVQWLTGDTNIVELRANVLYRVDDPVAWLFGVSDSLGADGDRSFALRRLGEASLTHLVASTTVQEVLASGKGALQVAARDRIQEAADRTGLGVRISSVEVIEARPPMMVDAAFKAVNDARAEADRLIVEARADRNSDLQSAEAEANRRVGAARSFAHEVTGKARGLVARLDAMRARGSGDAEAEPGGGAPERAALSASARRGIWFDLVAGVLSGARVTILPSAPPGESVEYVRRR